MSPSLFYNSSCFEFWKVKKIVPGSDCIWQESLICGKTMRNCPWRCEKEKYSHRGVCEQAFIWLSVAKGQRVPAERGKKINNLDVCHSEQSETSQGSSDVYQMNGLLHLFWWSMTVNYLLCPRLRIHFIWHFKHIHINCCYQMKWTHVLYYLQYGSPSHDLAH